MPNHLRLFQKRFDEAIEALQLTFTDVLLVTEHLDTRVQELERTATAQQARLTLLETQVRELVARLDGRQ